MRDEGLHNKGILRGRGKNLKLTPSLLGLLFGVFLLILSGIAGFYVPGGPATRSDEPAVGGVESVPAGGTASVPATASAPEIAGTALASATPSPVASVTAVAPVTATAAVSTVTPTVAPSPTPTASPTPPSPTPAPTTAPTGTPTPQPFVVYTIEEGDTLSDIADKYGVSIDSIIRYNGLSSPDDLQMGDQITIPLG